MFVRSSVSVCACVCLCESPCMYLRTCVCNVFRGACLHSL